MSIKEKICPICGHSNSSFVNKCFRCINLFEDKSVSPDREWKRILRLRREWSLANPKQKDEKTLSENNAKALTKAHTQARESAWSLLGTKMFEREEKFLQDIYWKPENSRNSCENCAWSVYLDTKKPVIRKVTSRNPDAKLHCYYHDKWAEPSTRAIKYWDPNDIMYTTKRIVCNLWLSKNWKAELPKSENDRVIPTNVKRAVWVRDKGQCVICRNKIKLEFDHIIPHSQGGSNTERNIQILCQECNRKKSNNIL